MCPKLSDRQQLQPSRQVAEVLAEKEHRGSAQYRVRWAPPAAGVAAAESCH